MNHDNNRVRQVLSYLKYQGLIGRDGDVAKALGYTQSGFSQLVNGHVPVSERFVLKLCAYDRNINPQWVLTGEGQMLLDGSLNSEQPPVKASEDNGEASALNKALDEIGEQRKLVSKAQEQIDRLITIIENLK